MTWNSAPPTLRGRLARHLGRLQQSLDAVGEQVREVVANAVGRTVAEEAVGEAVYDALCPRAGSARPLSHSSYSRQASTPRRSWDEPSAQRWGRAMAAGLQAMAWWLRRHSGQVSLLASLAVGAGAGLAVLVGHVSGVAGVVASAFGLAYLLDLMRSARSLFGRDATP